jgi:divalent metal cation (Fe/Co/Zn/Cd) transporter
VLVLALLVMVALYTFFVWAIKRGGSETVTARVLEYMDNKDDALDSAGSTIGWWQITLGTTQVCVARFTSQCA